MARSFIALIAAVLIFPQLLFADGFSDFRIPKHHVYSLNGSLSGWGSNDYSRHQTNYSKYTDYYGRASENGRWILDSDPLRIDLYQYLYSTGSLNRLRGSEKHDSTVAKHNAESQRLSESWRISADTRVYPWRIPIGLIAALGGSGSYGQGWDHYRNVTDVGAQYSSNCTDKNSFNFSYSANANVGLGYGRVRDAGPVYAVFVMEQRLRDLGVLTRDLKPETRQRLAQVLVAAEDHEVIRDRPDKYFWQDVERVLREDGALSPEGLDAYSAHLLAEPSNTRTEDIRYRYTNSISRQCGWFAGVLVQGAHSHRITRQFQRTREQSAYQGVYSLDSSYSMSAREEFFNDDVSVGSQIEYHRPLGMAWQLDAISYAMFPQDKDLHKAFNSSNAVYATWMIADRWLANGTFKYFRTIQETSPHEGEISQHYNYWGTYWGASLQYFVVDRMSLSLSLYHDQESYKNDYPDAPQNASRSYYRSTSFQLGLSYNFLGALEAPGLIPRSTLPKMEWPF